VSVLSVSDASALQVPKSVAGRPPVEALLALEYRESDSGRVVLQASDYHRVLLNLRRRPIELDEGAATDRDVGRPLGLFDVAITPAGSASGWHWRGGCRWMVVTLDPLRVADFAQQELGVILGMGQLHDLRSRHFPELCNVGLELKAVMDSKGLGRSVLFDSLARVFLIKLLDRAGEIPICSDRSGARLGIGQFRQVLEYVENHYGNKVTLAELASAANLSMSHFSRLFKKATGRSPMQFVVAYRIDQGRELVRRSDRSLIDIALRCGFADQAHFSRAFKRQVGMTPNQYRKRARQQDGIAIMDGGIKD